MKNTESQLVTAIIKYLTLQGYIAGKIKTVGIPTKTGYRFDRYLFRGVPDILWFKNEQIGWIECKMKYNKIDKNPYQVKFRDLCDQAGVSHMVAYSLDDIINAVEQGEL